MKINNKNFINLPIIGIYGILRGHFIQKHFAHSSFKKIKEKTSYLSFRIIGESLVSNNDYFEALL